AGARVVLGHLIADDEDLRVARDGQVRPDLDAPGAVGGGAERRANRLGLEPGGPDNAARVDALRVVALADGDAAIVDGGDAPAEQHLHAEAFEVRLGSA